ncbi:MAG: YbaB/EbfC family nucleoid-associated protein [Verrucomicrobiota bacterium]
MAGVGKLLKQAQKMQKQMQVIQEELAEQELVISSGGGAITVTITGQSEFRGLKIDPEFLKEDAEFIEETLLEAVREASQKAKETSEEAMSALSGGMPGFM